MDQESGVGALHRGCRKLIINARTWDVLLAHQTERLGAEAAERFMLAHFVKTEPLTFP